MVGFRTQKSTSPRRILINPVLLYVHFPNLKQNLSRPPLVITKISLIFGTRGCLLTVLSNFDDTMTVLNQAHEIFCFFFKLLQNTQICFFNSQASLSDIAHCHSQTNPYIGSIGCTWNIRSGMSNAKSRSRTGVVVATTVVPKCKKTVTSEFSKLLYKNYHIVL